MRRARCSADNYRLASRRNPLPMAALRLSTNCLAGSSRSSSSSSAARRPRTARAARAAPRRAAGDGDERAAAEPEEDLPPYVQPAARGGCRRAPGARTHPLSLPRPPPRGAPRGRARERPCLLAARGLSAQACSLCALWPHRLGPTLGSWLRPGGGNLVIATDRQRPGSEAKTLEACAGLLGLSEGQRVCAFLAAVSGPRG